MSLDQLQHITKQTPSGGTVLVLNTGALIDPEAEAMLQALHSRSIGGIKSHLEVLKARGAEKFMSTYYVGYGHKSIGDCGSCTIFVEGVSMLAAKAVQDWALYSGQEASTRYIDFATQPFVDPIGTEESKRMLEELRAFYVRGLTELVPDLKLRYPRGENEDEKVYDKAINARAFDILRGFLPAGATTNLAWHSNLRQVADKLIELRHHPLAEVREIADATEKAVLEAYPNSFATKHYEATEKYTGGQMEDYYFVAPVGYSHFRLAKDSVDIELLNNYRNMLSTRPAKTELPRRIAECGTVRFDFLLDFGSFRDLQRQRSVTQRMPLLTTEHGMHEWYLAELTPELRATAAAMLDRHAEMLNGFICSAEEKQYLTPMGYLLPNRLTGNLAALVYVVELRSTRFVHPTLRVIAQKMGHELLERFGSSHGLVLHIDDTEDRFDVGRGNHDIVKKD